MSDVNAEFSNRLACLWAEQHLNLPAGSVAYVVYAHGEGRVWSELTWEDSYTTFYAITKVQHTFPDPEWRDFRGWPYDHTLSFHRRRVRMLTYPPGDVPITVELGQAVKEMLALAESIIESGEKI